MTSTTPEIANPYLDFLRAAVPTEDWFGKIVFQVYTISGSTFQNYRDDLTKKYAWAIPDMHAVMSIARFASRIVEIGAGTGYWAKLLSDAGADVVAYDLHPPDRSVNPYLHADVYFPVSKGGPTAAACTIASSYTNEQGYESLRSYQAEHDLQLQHGLAPVGTAMP